MSVSQNTNGAFEYASFEAWLGAAPPLAFFGLGGPESIAYVARLDALLRAGDIIVVGAGVNGSPESAGTAIGDTVTFAGANPLLVVDSGAAVDGSLSAATAPAELTNVIGATNGLMMVFSATHSGHIANEDPVATNAATLFAAENAAVAALGAPGVAYFSYQGDEYFIATHHAETAVHAGDEVVRLVGVSPSGFVNAHVVGATDIGGVVTLISQNLQLILNH
ncbi:MAG: hypothetical protein WB816_18880 [Methylocystis sp.]